jgi:ACS family hexuronate transporter-like MFS transporter
LLFTLLTEVKTLSKSNLQLVKILIILFAAQISLTAGGLSVAPVAPFLKMELDLSETQIGLFVSLFYAGATLASLPSGTMTDSLGVKKVLIAGQFITGIFLLLMVLSGSYNRMILCMLLAGLGYGTINPVSTKAIMEWFPVNYRALAMGLKQTGVTVGGALSAAILPGVALTWGWRAAVLFCCAFLFIMGFLALLVYNNPMQQPKTFDGNESKASRNYAAILSNRTILGLSLTCMVLSASQLSLITYIVTYFYEHIHYSIIAAGGMLALAQTGGTVGRVVWGAIGDMFLGGRQKPVMVVVTAMASLTTLLIALSTPTTSYPLLAVLVTAAGFTTIGWNALFLIIIGQQAGEKLAGTATGLSLIFIFSGVIVGPPVFGMIIDFTGSYQVAFTVFAVLLGLSALSMLFLRISESGNGQQGLENSE